MMKVDNVSWLVKKKPIVADVSLEIREGEMFGLIGPNGSGKSSLLRLMAGLRKPSSGEVRLNGQNIRQMKRRDVAQQLAFVEQHADTIDAITVRDAVKLGRTPWLSPLTPWSAEQDAIVDEALVNVEMAHKAKQHWHTLSGGEKQRVHIARSLAQKAGMLMMDEPTNHLDIHHQLAILKLVESLNKTTVMAIHDLNQAQICDRIGVMRDGKLVAVGKPDDIFTSSYIEDVFRVKVNFIENPQDKTRIIHFS